MQSTNRAFVCVQDTAAGLHYLTETLQVFCHGLVAMCCAQQLLDTLVEDALRQDLQFTKFSDKLKHKCLM